MMRANPVVTGAGDSIINKYINKYIRSEKLTKHQYKERYTRSLKKMGVQWDGDNNVEHMWEEVKRAMVGSVR